MDHMKWRLFICSDCDHDDGVLIMQVSDDAHHERGCAVDNCPACDSYLSLLGMGEVEVTGSSLVHLRMRNSVDDE